MAKSLEEKLDDVIKAYKDKDIGEKTVRDTLVRDLINTMSFHSRTATKGATVMTPEASIYDPKTDTIPVRPKAV